jgi:NAD(P)-dependent dehydrogenase (short-subunit alcohol dehydrogenase family)
MVKYDFTDKVALVTGAASGMGFNASQKFGQAGAKVAMLDWNGENLERAAHDLREQGYHGFTVSFVAKTKGIES